MIPSIPITPSRSIGPSEPCFIVAEVGSNHNQSLNVAMAYIDLAASAGCDAVKFQVFHGEDLYRDIDMPWPKSSHDLPHEWLPILKQHADERGIVFFASPFDLAAVDALAALNVPLYKIASSQVENEDLLRVINMTGKPVILSGGFSTYESNCNVLRLFEGRLAVLHCVSKYPAPVEKMAMDLIPITRKTFRVPVGLSDHTLGIHISLAAAALGACVIEKHITFDRSLPGPDHHFAIEPDQLHQLVSNIRDIEKAIK